MTDSPVTQPPEPKTKVIPPKEHRCRGCGYPIHPSCDYCGECLCEDDME